MSQTNFFMLEEDERDFEHFVLGRTDTLIFSEGFFSTKQPKHVTFFPPSRIARDLSLINSIIAPTPVCSGVGGAEFSGMHTFAMYEDPLIQLQRSYTENGILYPGRIYAKIGWLKKREDNAVFRRWYAAFERYLKKKYKRIHNGWWIGPFAEQWSLNGGRIAFGCSFVVSLKTEMH